MSEPQLLYNAIRTPDGTVIESTDRHDFVCHTDSITGNRVCVDGGMAYLRRLGSFSECEDLSLYDSDPHDVIRERFTWGTYGVNGDQPLSRIKLKDMDIGHIEAIIDTQQHISLAVRTLFERELEFRQRGERGLGGVCDGEA